MISYGFLKELNIPFEKAVERVTEELKKEGFGILTTIDVKEKFKEKLGIEFKKYVILGACNPSFAHTSLLGEENIGLLLPCNVIVYENESGNANVSIIDPLMALGFVGNDDLKGVASEARERLSRVMNKL